MEKTLELGPNYTLANFILGQSYVQCAKFEQALAALKIAASLSGRLPSVVSSLGFAYALAGDKVQALEILNELHAQMGQIRIGLRDCVDAYGPRSKRSGI